MIYVSGMLGIAFFCLTRQSNRSGKRYVPERFIEETTVSAIAVEHAMKECHVFVSVGATATDQQELFVRAIEERLRSEGLTPHTVGRNHFGADAPLKTVVDLLDKCSGTVIIALERMYFEKGCEKRGGGPKERSLSEVKLATPWNQIEAAMAYSRGLPLLVIVEHGIKSEGLLERGYDWYVQTVSPDPAVMNTVEFNGVLSNWKQEVMELPQGKPSKARPAAELTMGELFSSLKPAQMWAFLVGIASLVAGAFWVGAKVFPR
jgi:hypothetical protein